MEAVDRYIEGFDEQVRQKLQQLRALVKQQAPEAVEQMSYGMPGYKFNGRPLVYFAGYKNHIGFYATPTGHTEFASELSRYKQGKGSVQFPLDEPLPLELITRIISFRIKENSNKKK